MLETAVPRHGAIDGLADGGKLTQLFITRTLYNGAVVFCHGWLEHPISDFTQRREHGGCIFAEKPGAVGHIRSHDRGEPALHSSVPSVDITYRHGGKSIMPCRMRGANYLGG